MMREHRIRRRRQIAAHEFKRGLLSGWGQPLHRPIGEIERTGERVPSQGSAAVNHVTVARRSRMFKRELDKIRPASLDRNRLYIGSVPKVIQWTDIRGKYSSSSQIVETFFRPVFHDERRRISHPRQAQSQTVKLILFAGAETVEQHVDTTAAELDGIKRNGVRCIVSQTGQVAAARPQ